MSFTHRTRQLPSRKHTELTRGSCQVPITCEFECVAYSNAQVLRDDSIPEDFNLHSALLAEYITSQEQINTKSVFSIVSYMLSLSKYI